MGEKYGLGERFWIWTYHQAQRRLPDDWMDEVWSLFIRERIGEMQRRGLPDDYIQLVMSDFVAEAPWETGREFRIDAREIRDER